MSQKENEGRTSRIGKIAVKFNGAVMQELWLEKERVRRLLGASKSEEEIRAALRDLQTRRIVRSLARAVVLTLASEIVELFRTKKKSDLLSNPEIAAVPKLGEKLIGLFCQRDFREPILGDLAERFSERAQRKGAKAARRWYWRQVIRSTGAFIWRWARRLVEFDEVLKRIGF